ncbi:MAG: aminotransferase class I/II-fold pyridoxal phosphate-dependent enzyme [Ruminococcaceae bacterium]|nr:aminotransferase class I/II-fold pyridoxal phosphate-dependent enzyme [Oscillospiraceae bacterium]
MDYQSLFNQSIASVKPSGIRKFFDIASEMDDVISLSVGEPDFKTPWHIREEGIDTLHKGKTRYSPNAGFTKLLIEIAAYYERRYNCSYDAKHEVLVTVGGSEAIDLCMRTLLSPGDEVLIPEPCFVCYQPLAVMAGGVGVPIVTKAEDGFRLTAEQLRNAITPRTKLLILPFPNNPTGAVMRREHLEEIAEVLRGTNIVVLSDEIYSELTYGETQHVSIAELDGMRERTVVVNGFSKSYSMTGWRLGFALGPAPIIQMMTKLHQYAVMCAPSTAQYAAIEALRNGDEDIAKMRGEYDMRRRYIVDGFRELGFECHKPEGAFYIFPSIKHTGMTSDEFCEKLLLSKHVAIVPGSAFGESGEGYARVSYSYSVKHIGEALRRIKEFIDEEL